MIDVGQATGPVYKVAFRRRRGNLTNYAKRLALIKGMVPRMVVRRSGRGVLVQFIQYTPKGDKVLSSVQSGSLSKHGWFPRCNAPTAYLSGLLAGKMALKGGVKEFNLDIGMQAPSKGSVVFAALQGAIDAGLKTNYTEKMIDDARVSGAQIAAYAKSLKASDPAKYGKIFSLYVKRNFSPENIVEAFKAAKAKIGAI